MSIPTTAALEALLQQHPNILDGQPLPHRAETLIPLYHQAISRAEQDYTNAPLSPTCLTQSQTLYRELEEWITHTEADDRHHFIITIPVADRPQQLERCLHSLYQLCEKFHYGQNSRGDYQKLTLLISDDSITTEGQTAIRQLTQQFSHRGIESIYFGPIEQQALLNQFSTAEQNILQRVAPLPRTAEQHKGASTTRNLAYLKLAELSQQHSGKLLFWFVDSDQEFRVNLSDGEHEDELYSINYLYQFDRIFTERSPVMVTGKLVGDPPVSPTVMANNLLLDLNHFLSQLAEQAQESPCQFHKGENHQEGEAAYHDMTDLFGYPVPPDAYEYRCTLDGAHDHSTCLNGFTRQLNAFFYGEHPTRRSYHQPEPLEQSIKPARTVYTANYLFTPEGLNAFIPFAALKLRMAGPMLGRLLEQGLGDRFLSVNLPMVHKRTLDDSTEAEHRPGVTQGKERPQIDLSGEFERQFYGDVMLFTLERLVKQEYPTTQLSHSELMQALQQTEQQMRARYLTQQQQITERLQQFEQQLNNPSAWWNNSQQPPKTVQLFIQNIRRNFLQQAPVWKQINSDKHRNKRLQSIADALLDYPLDRQAWANHLQKSLGQS